MIIIAHRGASGTEPENTLRAFKRAVQLKCRWIECDVRITKDGVPVIIHDAMVNRTTNGRGRVSGTTYQVLRKLDAGKKEKIPSLKETLQFAKKNKINLILEIKDLRALKKTLTLIQTHKLTNSITISSFSSSTILRAKQLMPSLATALIIANPFRDWVRAATRAKADMVHVHAALATRKNIERAHAAGLAVWAWTVNSKKTALQMQQMGVDGIFTDYPGRMKSILNFDYLT